MKDQSIMCIHSKNGNDRELQLREIIGVSYCTVVKIAISLTHIL